ncbi:MAG: glycine betaine ABC transporter substrate-binding protein [Arenicella sp.]
MNILLCRLIVLVVFLLCSSVVKSQETVRIAHPEWSSAKVISGLLKVVIEDRLNGKAELVPGAVNDVIYTSMHLGNGEIDIHPDVWLPNQENFTKLYVENKKTVKLSKNSYVGRSGFCVSKEFSQKYNVTSIHDLLNPEIAELADIDNNGKGDIWVGNFSWLANKINRVKLKSYGLSNLYRHYSDKEDVVREKMNSPKNANKHFIYYCYEPNHSWVSGNQVMLVEPKYDRNNNYMTWPNENPRWYKMSKVKTADKLKAVHVGYSTSVDRKSPVVSSFLENIQLDTPMVNAMVHELVIKKRNVEDIAREWVKNNPERVDSWLVNTVKVDKTIGALVK